MLHMPSFATLSKIGPDFCKKVVFKLRLQKTHFNKKSASKLVFFNEKKSKRFDDFWYTKFTLKSPIFPLCNKAEKLGKTSWDAYT